LGELKTNFANFKKLNIESQNIESQTDAKIKSSLVELGNFFQKCLMDNESIVSQSNDILKDLRKMDKI
jgi:hypothetical protein